MLKVNRNFSERQMSLIKASKRVQRACLSEQGRGKTIVSLGLSLLTWQTFFFLAAVNGYEKAISVQLIVCIYICNNLLRRSHHF